MTDLRSEIQAIYDRHGKLTPGVVLEEARDPGHALHNRFEWDDSEAAERWRKHQAHELIQSVKVVYAHDRLGAKEIRAFHAVRGNEGYSYWPHEEVVQDEFITKLVLADMEREWKQLRTRYEQFKEFWQLVQQSAAERQSETS